MQNSIRFSAAYAGLAVATAGGLLVLTGCSSNPSKTSGSLDEVKYAASVKAVAAKTHTESQTVKKTKRVCVGTGYKKTCTDRNDGTKTVRVTVTDKPAKSGKSAMYCVELDNVGGNKDKDDQIFEVSWKTYSKWENKGEGTPVTDMEYFRSVSECSR